jgi:homogentisate 1,2-dioxygenase
LPDDKDSLLLVVEAPTPIRMAELENVGRHTPIDPTMLEVPDVVDYGWPEQPEYEVRLRHGLGPGGGHSSIFYRNDPLKVAGWKGDLFPFKLNIRHILPIVPQVAVSDPNAEELPSYHRNIDIVRSGCFH